MKKTFKVSMILPIAITTAFGIFIAVLITALVGMFQVRQQVQNMNTVSGETVLRELNEKVAVEIAVDQTLIDGVMSSFKLNDNHFDIPLFAEMVETMFLQKRESALCIDIILFDGYFLYHPIIENLRNDLNNVAVRVLRDRVGNIYRDFLPAEEYRNGEWYTTVKERQQMVITTPRLANLKSYGDIYVFEISFPLMAGETFVGAGTIITHTQDKFVQSSAADYFGAENVRTIENTFKNTRQFDGTLSFDDGSWVCSIFPLQLGTTVKEGFVGFAMPSAVLVKATLIPLLSGLGIGIAVLIVVLVIIYILNNRLAKYIVQLKDTAIEIAGGNYSVNPPKLPFSSKDNELVIFGEELDKMIESIRYKEKVVRVIANKDLTMNIDLASDKDELGKILKGLQVALTDFFVQTDIAVNQVKNGSQQIADASQSQSQGATEQASAVEEISASLHEINVQSKNNADKSDEANKYARLAADYARAGNEKMNVLLGLMNEISQASDQTKAVVKAIDEIAEEVRNLAKKSAQSVLETQTIVDTIIGKIQDSVQFANDTSKQLTDILKEADVTSQYLQEIAVASKEQSQGIEQISKAIGQIEQVTQSNSANAEEGAAAAEELAAQAVQLHSQLEEIKFERTGGAAAQNYASTFLQNAHASVTAQKDGIDDLSAAPSAASVIKLDDSDYGNF